MSLCPIAHLDAFAILCSLYKLESIHSSNLRLNNAVYWLFAYFGDISYYLYLFHWPILVVIKHFISTWYILLLSVLIGTIVTAFLFDKLLLNFEKRGGGVEGDSIT